MFLTLYYVILFNGGNKCGVSRKASKISICIMIVYKRTGGAHVEEFSLSAATWFWLLVPMPLVVILSVISFFVESKGEK